MHSLIGMWYDIQFVTIWSFSIFVIPLALASFLVSFERNHMILLCITMWSIAWAILVRTRGSKIAIRVAAWPGICGNDRTPSVCSVEALLARLQDVPTIVGSGWGYFLKRNVASGPCLFMHNFRGPMPGEHHKPAHERRWAAGTTIREVADALKKDNWIFPSHPSNDDITIGSWFAFGNHGSGGDKGMPSSKCMKDATIIDMRTKRIHKHVAYDQVRAWFDAQPQRYLIVDVLFDNLVRDMDIQKRCIEIPLDMSQIGVHHVQEWLDDGAYLRVCFLGAGRSVALGIRWEDKYLETSHRDPHCCSRFCTFLQADVCSAACGWYEPTSKWNGVTSWSDANRWVPTLFPINTLFVVLQGYRNFEIVVDMPELSADTLWHIMKGFKDMHDSFGGRSEFRYATRYLFIDVAMQGGFQTPFIILDEYGVENIALHPGKWMPDTILVREISLSEMYGITIDDMNY